MMGSDHFTIEVRNGFQKHQKWQRDICPTLTAAMGMGGGYTPVITIPIERNTREIESERGHRTQQTQTGRNIDMSKDEKIVPKVIGGIGEKTFGKQWRQGDRVYDGEKIATAVEAHPVGNSGGNTNLYSLEVEAKEATERDCSNTLDTDCNQGMFVEISPDLTVYAVWYPKKQCYIAIRKLTPKECFRLQGWTDDYFKKAEFVCSNSQLYKQAGNGVTVNVIEAIGKKMHAD